MYSSVVGINLESTHFFPPQLYQRDYVNTMFFFSQVGLGSFLLRYLPGLLRTILTEIGISEDMYNPVCKLY